MLFRSYNAFLTAEKRRNPAALYGVTIFSSLRYVTRYGDRPISAVPLLSPDKFRAVGRTPLYDALTRSIEALLATDPPSGVRFIVETDGRDNESVTATRESVAALIAQVEKDHDWSFVYRGAHLGPLQEAVSQLR